MDEKAAEQIERTWQEVGQRARPLRRMVFVRTELLPEKVGSLWLPPDQRSNYAKLGHQVLMRALVLSTGPQCRVLRAGDRVAFMRLFFAWWHKLSDGSLVGWIDEENIAAYALTEEELAKAAAEAEARVASEGGSAAEVQAQA